MSDDRVFRPVDKLAATLQTFVESGTTLLKEFPLPGAFERWVDKQSLTRMRKDAQADDPYTAMLSGRFVMMHSKSLTDQLEGGEVMLDSVEQRLGLKPLSAKGGEAPVAVPKVPLNSFQAVRIGAFYLEQVSQFSEAVVDRKGILTPEGKRAYALFSRSRTIMNNFPEHEQAPIAKPRLGI